MAAVRRAILSDAPRLAELSAELGYPVPVAQLSSTLERVLARPDDAVFVATCPIDLGSNAPDDETKSPAPDAVVGWIHVAERQILEVGDLGEILGLVVDASVRRQHVGHQLVAAAEAWAASRGLPGMTVRSNVVRSESHPFYEALGYARIKTQHTYRKVLVS